MIILMVLALFSSSAFANPDMLELATNLNTTIFVDLVQKAGLSDEVKNNGPITIFVPTDAAFNAADQDKLNTIKADTAKLKDLLMYHSVDGDILDWDMTNGEILQSRNGHVLRIYKSRDKIYINNARVLRSDVQASNGMIYLIDSLLDVPEGTITKVLGKKEYLATKFLELVAKAHFDTSLNHTHSASTRYTVFAPSNDAFAKLNPASLQFVMENHYMLRELVEYHIHSGTLHFKSFDHDGRVATMYRGHYINVAMQPDGTPRLNQVAQIDQSDIEADNGIVHVISHVLVPSTLAGHLGTGTGTGTVG